jgi:cytochrome c
MKADSIAHWACAALAAGTLAIAGQASAQVAAEENPAAAKLAKEVAAMPSVPPNPEAARVLALKNGCFRCHAIDKTPEKVGPNWKSVGDRFRPLPASIQPIIQERLIYHLISGETANFPDGHSEHHKYITTRPPNDPAQIKNLVDWILSL